MTDRPTPPLPRRRRPDRTDAMRPRPDHGETSYKGSGRPAGQPAELAPIYVMLASPESSYVTDAPAPVTGGRPML